MRRIAYGLVAASFSAGRSTSSAAAGAVTITRQPALAMTYLVTSPTKS